jgi:hypothetical protein
MPMFKITCLTVINPHHFGRYLHQKPRVKRQAAAKARVDSLVTGSHLIWQDCRIVYRHHEPFFHHNNHYGEVKEEHLQVLRAALT